MNYNKRRFKGIKQSSSLRVKRFVSTLLLNSIGRGHIIKTNRDHNTELMMVCIIFICYTINKCSTIYLTRYIIQFHCWTRNRKRTNNIKNTNDVLALSTRILVAFDDGDDGDGDVGWCWWQITDTLAATSHRLVSGSNTSPVGQSCIEIVAKWENISYWWIPHF